MGRILCYFGVVVASATCFSASVSCIPASAASFAACPTLVRSGLLRRSSCTLDAEDVFHCTSALLQISDAAACVCAREREQTGKEFSWALATHYSLDKFTEAFWINPGYTWLPQQSNARSFSVSQRVMVSLNPKPQTQSRSCAEAARVDWTADGAAGPLASLVAVEVRCGRATLDTRQCRDTFSGVRWHKMVCDSLRCRRWPCVSL